ncbi:hypothetical protein [Fimbriimonas ginsengisoli]|uniref:Uncharacterized protein n=1 Tax=Fimbriimonas ginsengisoli Gsoil 348 TaxID=661478 RepID=A0A068NIX8_FIMGI|nr:hypothetical protein [Fimbriimonas ginsengisoli]AIE83422.1 hypothetical protein OP10G_0054 [Fimbriimonas ginsengisoli Gsoil 348]
MRLAPIVLLTSLAACCLGQSAGGSLFNSTRFDATIVVRTPPIGPSLLEVTVLKPTYSHELLRSQIELMGKELHFVPGAVAILDHRFDASDPSASVVKASFTMGGLVDREHGILRLQPIARSFALASANDKLDALMVQFEGERAGTNTLQACSESSGCSGARLEGRVEEAPFGTEYRIKLLGHDPDKIIIPDDKRELPAPKPVKAASAHTDWTLIALLVVAAFAFGALVYSLLSRGRPRTRA